MLYEAGYTVDIVRHAKVIKMVCSIHLQSVVKAFT